MLARQPATVGPPPPLAAAARIVVFVLGVLAAIGLGPAQPGGGGAGAIPADRYARNVAVITIKEPINKTTALSVQRRIKDAERAGADVIVFELDTPGGEVGAVLEISSAIKTSPIRTVAWVNTKAYSGGALVALACNDMIVNDPAALGDAKPIEVALGTSARPISPEMREKILPPLIGDMVDSVQRRNRAAGGYLTDELLVQGIVISDARLWYIENKHTGERMCITPEEFRVLFPEESMEGPGALAGAGFSSAAPQRAPAQPAPETHAAPTGDAADVTPASRELERLRESISLALSGPSLRPRITPAERGRWTLLFKASDGTGPLILSSHWLAYFNFASNIDTQGNLSPVRNDQDLAAYFNATTIKRFDASWSERLVDFLTNPVVRGLLIVVFLLGLFLEMTHPGLILPGAVAGLALITVLAPPLIIGMAGWWEVAAIIAGILLIAMEILVIPGFGLPGILGFILLFVGLVGTFIPGGNDAFPNTRNTASDLTWGVTTVVLSMATALVGMFMIGKYFGQLPVLKRMVLKNPEPGGGEDLLLAMRPSIEGAIVLGAEGRALTPLRPAGRAQFDDELVDVVAELGYIEAGARVRIVSVSGFRIGVDLAPPAAGPPGSSGAGSTA